MQASQQELPRSARRRFMMQAAAALALPLALPRSARAALPDALLPHIRSIAGDAPIRQGRVRLEIPRIAENGNSIELRVAVDSPMSATDHVKGISLLAERNPRPLIGHFHLGPRAGRAELATRIRLAGTQRVVALAALSDGSFWADTADVLVTVSACIDGT